jgi:hypothetical protein
MINLLRVNKFFALLIVLFLSSALHAQFEGRWAVFVSDTTQLAVNNAEQKIVDYLLDSLGFEAADRFQTSNISDGVALGYDLVIIGASVNSGNTVASLPTLASYEIPVINYEPFLFDHLGFQENGMEGGEYTGTSILIVNDEHPLAAGLSDSVTVFTGASVGIGFNASFDAATEYTKVAVNPLDTAQVTIFGIETGAQLYSGETLARRVGGFLLNNVADSMTTEGWQLFTASVYWALEIEPTSVTDNDLNMPDQFTLYQNFPNPFNPTTTIKYSTSQAGNVEITIWNVLGEKVADLANGYHTAGEHKITFNASGFTSGIYFCQMKAGHVVETQKMVLLK